MQHTDMHVYAYNHFTAAQMQDYKFHHAELFKLDSHAQLPCTIPCCRSLEGAKAALNTIHYRGPRNVKHLPKRSAVGRPSLYQRACNGLFFLFFISQTRLGDRRRARVNSRVKVGVHITPQMVRLLYTSLHCGYLWRYMHLACNSRSAECWAQLSYAATFGVNSRVGPGAYGMKARYLYLYYRKCPPCRI